MNYELCAAHMSKVAKERAVLALSAWGVGAIILFLSNAADGALSGKTFFFLFGGRS